ncbi:MAG: SDR family oxidoreductase [Actinobacteria bacterium]|nr:SDR family oxidoreductase [Actinomycetota bacterium]
MLSGISDKVALVTGAARPRSIGRATAVRLAAEGAKVACLDIARPYDDFPDYAVASSDDLDQIVEEIRSGGAEAIAVRADVSDEEAVRAAIDRIVAELGTVELVANVAGGSGAGMGAAPLLAVSRAEFLQVLEVNLVGTWLVSRTCAEVMIEHGTGGRIVNTSSQAGKVGWPLIGAYSAAKAGVISLTQVMAKEWAGSDIRVNAVCPGTVDTDLLNPGDLFVQLMDAAQPGGFQGWVDREIPLGRMQRASEVASVIAFLMSDDASYVTGEAVNVSGGQTMA